MSNPTLRLDRRPRPDPLTVCVRALAFAVGAVLVSVLAAGCLPSGERGAGSGSTGSGAIQPSAITASPGPTGPTPRPSIVPPTPTPVPTFLVYVVVKGDSLNTIAHKFGTTARSIAFWNRATYPSLDPESAHYQPNLLRLGWTLFVRPNDVVDEQNLPDASSDAPSDGPSGSPVLLP
jgi:LysM domain